MDYLQHQISIGELKGVKITDDLIICHKLFIDDVGIFIPVDEHNFQKLQEALRVYKLVSREKLNLEKSVVIPLAMTTIPQWL